MLYKYGKRTPQLLGRFYFHFSLVFYNFEAFLIKQLFHSRLLDIEDITRWREDMDFMFEWQERSERVRYSSCHENIESISSS